MTNNSALDDSSTFTDVIGGGIYMVVTVGTFVPYVIMLKIMATDETLNRLPCYRIMFYAGVVDVIELFLHFWSGPLTICQCISSTPFLNKIYGAIANGLWMSVVPLRTLLALNRYITICKEPLVDSFFGGWKLSFYMCMCLVYAGGYIASYLTPYVGVMYFDSLYGWGYDDSPLSLMVKSLEFWTILVQVFITLILYLGCGWYIKSLINMATDAQRKDINIFVQAVLTFVYFVLCLTLWHVYELLFTVTKLGVFIINMTVIGMFYINVIVYFCFNTTLRRKFMAYLRPPQAPAKVHPLVKAAAAKKKPLAGASPMRRTSTLTKMPPVENQEM